MICENLSMVPPALVLHSELPNILAQARTPLELLCALAEAGFGTGLDLYALALVEAGEPAMYLCTTAPLAHSAVAGHLAHFAAAVTVRCPAGGTIDWESARQQVVCLRPGRPSLEQELAEYRDVTVALEEDVEAVIRGARLYHPQDSKDNNAWQHFAASIESAVPRLQTMYLATSQPSQTMFDAESGTYTCQYFLDAMERELERARRQEHAQLAMAVVEFCPTQSNAKLSSDLHRLVGEHVANAVRRSDMVGRIGKRSYAVFFHNTGPRRALIAAGRIVEALRSDAQVVEQTRFSVGVSGWEGEGVLEVSGLLSQASQAASEAAAIAPNRAFVYV